ncbi:MAG: ATPase inhibitor subunit zeta [Candidatus Sulfotelmatobacter sp.]
MGNSDELRKTIRRNKMLGIWAAQKLGLTGADAEGYSDALAVGTIDPDRADVFSQIRKEFDLADVVQSDDQILCVMNELMLQVSNGTQVVGGGNPDAAAVMIARNLSSR